MIAHSLSCEIKRRGIKQTTIASVCGLTAQWVDYEPTQTSDILK